MSKKGREPEQWFTYEFPANNSGTTITVHVNAAVGYDALMAAIGGLISIKGVTP